MRHLRHQLHAVALVAAMATDPAEFMKSPRAGVAEGQDEHMEDRGALPEVDLRQR